MSTLDTRLHTIRKQYQVEKEFIGFIRFIFEGYDGIAVITTKNAETGQIIITIAPGCEEEVHDVIHSLKDEIMITPVDFDIPDTEIIY
ncbi:MAG: DUF4911 domain-containing protein [Proteobacteria bacterium]|nr:DUF4911 domain-containing protein [Pseudomonadota bacterium]